jgi:ABC-2 type transport system permease protein
MPRTLRQFFGFSKASFKSLLRDPSAWAYGFAFPIIFIILFGFISNDNAIQIEVGFVKDDTGIYTEIKNTFDSLNIFEVNEKESYDELLSELEKGNLDGLIRILPGDKVQLVSNANKPENVSVIAQTLDKVKTQKTFEQNEIEQTAFEIESSEVNSRKSKYIDFVLPGILGYSILSSAIFGVAYSFLTLRKENILKRIFAGPARSGPFILGESFSRMVYILLQNIVLILIATAFFGFRPVDGTIDLLQIFVIMLIGLIVFLGFGYLVASFAKTDEVVSSVANIVVLPQFILGGTFFSVSTLPNWLQIIAKSMPLYHFNEAVRNISLNGFDLWQAEVFTPIIFLLLWGILAYTLAAKLFRIK